MSEQKKRSFIKDFVVGGVSATVSKTVAAPLERVKLVLQTQDILLDHKILSVKYSGTLNCLRRIYTEEGVLSFWRGNLPNILRYIPVQALNFSIFNKIKPKKSKNPSPKEILSNVLSGGTAGVISLTVTYSLEFSRTRLALDAIKSNKSLLGRQFSGMVDVYVRTFKENGILGFYRGYLISVIATFLYRGVYFGSYETAKAYFVKDDSYLILSIAIGYLSTLLSSCFAYPYDTIRRRLMLFTGTELKPMGNIECISKMIKEEGYLSFYKGFGINIARSISGGLTLFRFL